MARNQLITGSGNDEAFDPQWGAFDEEPQDAGSYALDAAPGSSFDGDPGYQDRDNGAEWGESFEQAEEPSDLYASILEGQVSAMQHRIDDAEKAAREAAYASQAPVQEEPPAEEEEPAPYRGKIQPASEGPLVPDSRLAAPVAALPPYMPPPGDVNAVATVPQVMPPIASMPAPGAPAPVAIPRTASRMALALSPQAQANEMRVSAAQLENRARALPPQLGAPFMGQAIALRAQADQIDPLPFVPAAPAPPMFSAPGMRSFGGPTAAQIFLPPVRPSAPPIAPPPGPAPGFPPLAPTMRVTPVPTGRVAALLAQASQLENQSRGLPPQIGAPMMGQAIALRAQAAAIMPKMAFSAGAMFNHAPIHAAHAVVGAARRGAPRAIAYVHRTVGLAQAGSAEHVPTAILLSRAGKLANAVDYYVGIARQLHRAGIQHTSGMRTSGMHAGIQHTGMGIAPDAMADPKSMPGVNDLWWANSFAYGWGESA